MGKFADRIVEVEPIAEPPAYNFLHKRAGEISDLLKEADSVKDKLGGIGLICSLQRRAPAEWDQSVWEACLKFGVDEVRVAGRCLKKRGFLWFLPKAKPQLRVLHGGRQ